MSSNPLWNSLSWAIFNAPPSAVEGVVLGTTGVSPSEVAAAQSAYRRVDEFGREIGSAAQTATTLMMLGGAALLLYFIMKK